MAAKLEEGVTERLIEAAKEEFLEKGFEKASLRTIARKAGSSKGAIYNRYPDKAALFSAIVDPAAEGLCRLLEEGMGQFTRLPGAVQKESMSEYGILGFNGVIAYIYDHLDEVRLLIMQGERGRYADFLHRIVEIDTRTTLGFIEATGNDAITSGRLTPELAHMLSNAFYSAFFEVVVHNMPIEEARDEIGRLSVFYRAGWGAMFNP